MDHGTEGWCVRAYALHNVNGSLRIQRTFHIDPEKIVIGSSACGDRAAQPLAKLDFQVQAELRQLAGYIGVELFPSDALIYFEIGVTRSLCIRCRRTVLSKIIEADEHSGVVAGSGGFDGFIESLSGDKASRHTARGAVGCDPFGEAGTL